MSAADIDKMNILQASLTAMHSALDAAWEKHAGFRGIAVDGIHFLPWVTPATRFTDEPDSLEAHCIPQGDNALLCVAAASILAKVERDSWVEAYLQRHPEVEKYGLKTNMGYGTLVHMNALRDHGPHALHRHSFRPVMQARREKTESSEESACKF